MEEDLEVGERVLVEAKTFQFFPHLNGFKLRESHKQGERDLFITGNQSDWIAKGMEFRHKSFEKSIRREAAIVDGSELVLIEGSNKKGIFLAIQVKKAKLDCCFVVVPAGSKGKHWLRVAKMIGIVRTGICNNVVPKFIQDSNKVIDLEKSYVDSVRGISGKEKFKLLQARIETLEKEIKFLWDVVIVNGVKVANGGVSVEEPPITASIGGADATVSVAAENPIVGKTGGEPLDGSEDRAVEITSSHLPILVSVCSRFIQEISALCANFSEFGDSNNCLGDFGSHKSVNTHSSSGSGSTTSGNSSEASFGKDNLSLTSSDDDSPELSETQDASNDEVELGYKGDNLSSAPAICCSMDIATLEVGDDKEISKEKKRWERCAAKLKDNLRKEEEAYSKEEMSEEISTF